MIKQIFSSILIKKDGKWEHTLSVKKDQYNELMDNLPDGSKIELFIEVSGKKGTHAQLKRIHAMIRQLANDIGDDPISLKADIKEKAMIPGKSFKDCDTEELNSVIQTILSVGDMLGSNLR
tara:strand:- start:1289 stop:1651 length:363 start_codon:yes stop_codon:yes gene_type:complete